jgi:lactoylglutathione lyase
MRICHAALYVKDLGPAVRFYETYFGGRPGGLYHNPKRGFRSCFVEFGGGPLLELMALDAGLREGSGAENHAGYDHIAFDVGSRADVDKLTQRLKDDGVEIVSGPRITGDGHYESCALDCGGNRVEITCSE